MSDHAAPTRTPASARRPALSQTILSVAATATAVAALIWSALFYDATRNHAVALPVTPTQSAPAASGAAQPAPTVAPVTTRTS
jgi:hypothetical protein